MNYKLDLGIWSSVFCIPAVVVDKYLKLAGENDIKVLLFLLRNSQQIFSSSQIAEELNIADEEAEESINFWQQRKVIKVDKDDGLSYLEPSEDNETPAKSSPKTSENGEKAAKSLVHKINLERTPEFAPAEIAQTVKESDRAKYLFDHCEMLYGRPLKHNEQNTLVLMLEDACLPVEVALILVDCCFSVKKATPAYMRTLAAEWAESEINTIEKAEKRMEEIQNFHNAVARFKKMFEVDSTFSKDQRDLINKWVNVYKFGDDMVNEAYQRTLNATGKFTAKYMDKILSDWNNQGIKAIEQISQDKRQYAKQEKGENASFDIKEIEQLMEKKHKQSGGNS